MGRGRPGVAGITAGSSRGGSCHRAVRGFELEDDLAGRGAAQAFMAEGGARDVAAQSFECLALMADLALREVSNLGVLCDNITYGK